KTIRNKKDAVGRTVLASVVTGYPLSETILAARDAGEGLQAMVPSGMRSVTVDVSESSGVAGLLVPGCHVDVIATLRNGEQSVAKTIVENVKVQFVARSRTGRMGRTSMELGEADVAGPAKTVTLIVTPKQANTIELANSQGKTRLVLRGNADVT